MGRKRFVVSWLWMVLAFDYFINLNVSSTTIRSSSSQSYTNYDHELNITTPPLSSQLSGSERTRRLIPYMAFYLSPSQIPINQQYAIPMPQQNQYPTNSSENQEPPTAIESAGPLAPSGYIALPTYFKATDISGTASTPIYNVEQQKQLRYRPVNYENPYPATHNSQGINRNRKPIVHLLPPPSIGHTTVPAFRGRIFRGPSPNKHKTIQHFPPLNPHDVPSEASDLQQQSKRLQEEPILFRQRPQSSKINLTPFTSSNTVPGHFVPIIYSSLRDSSSHDENNKQSGKIINYNYDDMPEEPTSQLQQQSYQQSNQQQQMYVGSYKELQQAHQQQQQIVAEPLPLPSPADTLPSGKETHLLYRQQNPQQQAPQINFVAIAGLTGPSAGSLTSTQSGPIYHIIKEASPTTPLSSHQPQYQPLITLKPQKQPQHLHRPSKHPNFQTLRPENFFTNEQLENDGRQQQQIHQEQPQQQFFSVNDLTPQEKYVLYLRQRIRYNKQQQNQKQKQHQQAITKDKKHYLISQYHNHHHHQQQQQQQSPSSQKSPEIFIYSTVASPVDSKPIPLQHHPTTEPNQQNYDNHSPVSHAVYVRPQISVPANHQPTSQSQMKPLQQVLHIPVQTLLSEIDSLQKNDPNKMTRTQNYHVKEQSKYIHSYGNSNSQYTNDVVEEPKQALEEQYPLKISNQQSEFNSISPPQAAYIIITTTKPPYQMDISTEQQEYHLSTQRPIYQQLPTLRLKPITAQGAKYPYVTKRPTIVLSSTTPTPLIHNSITKPYDIKYVPTTKSYGELMSSPSPAIKLRPAVKYETNTRKPTIVPVYIRPTSKNYELEDPNQLPDISSLSLAEILHKLQASNHLPQTLTADNIDNSIKTLITILNNLKKTQKIVPNPSQHHEPPPTSPDYDYSNGSDDEQNSREHDLTVLAPPTTSGPNKHPGPSTGRAGIDYPNYAEIPQTSFDCSQQRYKGFFGDPETNCQVWHYCDLNGGKASFLCPNGTIFSQIALTCDWWFNVKCSTTAQLYVLNERLYKYILPFNPKFPEDYSGPLVDKYLAMKFQEMEEKMRLEKEKLAVKTVQAENHIEDTTISDYSTVSPENTRHKIDEQSSEKNLLTDDIAEDLAQKGGFDTYESTTQKTTAIEEYENNPVSLSIKPIVVSSSTVEPDHSSEIGSIEEDQANTDITQEQTDDERKHINFQRSPTLIREQIPEIVEAKQKQNQKNLVDSSKISVEKVEVIEIKSDGTSGHLTPEMFFANEARTR